MKKKYSATILLVGSLSCIGVPQVNASLFSNLLNKETATWHNCDVSGCNDVGSTYVTSDYTKTKYPIVLVHGMNGFSSIGPLNYWNGISEDLVMNGAQVFVVQQAPFQSSEVRGEQTLKQVKQILAITGAKKVNLIGHSHGSQSSRYVAGLLPSSVASVTSVGGPNKGSEAMDAMYQILTTPVLNSTLAPATALAFNTIYSFVSVGSGHYYEEDFLAGIEANTTAALAKFNQKFPAGIPITACGSGAEVVNGVRYYSWSGTKVLTNSLDPIDYFLTATSFFMPPENDGLVSRCSSHLGTVIRDDYAFNHLDEVNQVLGLVGFLQDPLVPYRQHANRLKNLGL